MKKIKSKSQNALQVGNKVFIRAVTNYVTGKVIEVCKDEIVLVDAAWIADTGRFSNALKSGASLFNEIEPYPLPVTIGRGAIVDATHWPHDLPREQKP